MPAPRGILCHICGGKFFKHSLPIHLKKCEEMWRKTHSECANCGQMVHKADWSDHFRHCKKKLSKNERKFAPKGPPKPMTDNRTGNLSPEEAAALIEAGSLPALLPQADARQPCKICGRKFNPDRIDKHTRICFERKKKSRKRKVWDGQKKRLENTDFEQYAGRNRPPTPEIIDQWKKYGRRWRKETSDFRKIIHADDPEYEPPPIHPLTMARIKKATASLSARRKNSARSQKADDVSVKHSDDDYLAPAIENDPVNPPSAFPDEEQIECIPCPPKQAVEEAPSGIPLKKPTFSPKIVEKVIKRNAEKKVESKREQRPQKEVKSTRSESMTLKSKPLAPKKRAAGPPKKGREVPRKREARKRDPSQSHSAESRRSHTPQGLEMNVKKITQRRRNPKEKLSSRRTGASREGRRPRSSQRTSKKPAIPQATKKPAVPRMSKKPAIPRASKKPAVPRVSKKPAVPRASRKPNSGTKKPTVSRASKKPGVPRISKKPAIPSNRRKQKKPEPVKVEDIAKISDAAERQKKLDELLSRRSAKPVAAPEPKKQTRRAPRSSITNTGASIVGEPQSSAHRSNVHKGSGRLGKRGDEIRANPNYQPPGKKLNMEEYRNREKRRRQASASRSYSRPTSNNENYPPQPKRREISEISPNVENGMTGGGSGPRKLAHKKFWEPQSVGGKSLPRNKSELRRRRASFFENLFSNKV